MATCDDLRLGGTLSASGITGGLSINSTAIHVVDWSGVLGHTGISLTPFGITGRPGETLVGDGLPKSRFLTLNMELTRWGPTNGGLVEATEAEQLVENTDQFLTLLSKPAGNYLELVMPDTTLRFVHATALDPAQINQARTLRQISVPMFASPYWRAGGNQSTDTINGADTIVNGGLVNVYDPILVFSGDGSFTNSTAGWTLSVTGSTGAVTVDVGARTVTMGGNPADQVLTPTPTDREWAWFLPGNNTVTSNVSVGVTWRSAFN